ncbi:MAG: hypothetical protein JRD89_17550 [Deltaproteobacteria bacterium]|nr:hypothetical protein [Deltaproteobacteria bacterium]
MLREVGTDIFEEHGDAIKDKMVKFFWKQFATGVTKGLPEFYKQYLAEKALEE